MKRVLPQDLKPGYYWLVDAKDGAIDPVQVYEGSGGTLYYFHTGDECETLATKDDKFFEMIKPVAGEIELFAKSYDGESMYDFDRDTSEAIMSEYNPLIGQIPVDEHGFQEGEFEVSIIWRPINEQA